MIFGKFFNTLYMYGKKFIRKLLNLYFYSNTLTNCMSSTMFSKYLFVFLLMTFEEIGECLWNYWKDVFGIKEILKLTNLKSMFEILPEKRKCAN